MAGNVRDRLFAHVKLKYIFLSMVGGFSQGISASQSVVLPLTHLKIREIMKIRFFETTRGQPSAPHAPWKSLLQQF